MSQLQRNFFRKAGMFGLAALLSCLLTSAAFGQDRSRDFEAGLGFVVPKEVLNEPLYKLTRAMFTDNLDTKFTFFLRDKKLTEMTLIEVNNLNPPFVKGDGTSSRDCFSLVFRGPLELALQQDTYTLEHSTLGSFQLFVVPGETVKSWRRYAALINRVYP
jgi:hypothetical protein